MSRPKKDGLDYFPVDTVFDEKIDAIESIHHNNGIVWVLRFWQKAYRTLTGMVDFNGLFAELFANKCRITLEEHENILKTAVLVDFCHEVSTGVYTSNGIQKRISSVSNDRKQAIERQNRVNKKKEKKSKVKECPTYSANNDRIIIPDYLLEIWPKYVEMRKKIKKPVTESVVVLALEKLNSLSKDHNEQIKIIEQSIFNSWQGLFPLKENQSKQANGRVVHDYERNTSSKYDGL